MSGVGDKYAPHPAGGWIRFLRSREEFEQFAAENDEIDVRAAYEQQFFDGEAAQAAAEWLLRRERESADRAAAELRDAQDRAVRAAERSARWTIWAAVGACASAVASAASVIVPMLVGK